MLKRNRQARIDHPEHDSAFSALKIEQEQCHRRIDEHDRTIAKGRARLDQLASEGVAGSRIDPKETRRVADEVNKARSERAETLGRLRELATQLPHARHKAARTIASKHAPEMNKAAGAFLAARLQRLAPEIVAVHSFVGLRDALEGRRIGFYGMALPQTAIRSEHEFSVLREDILAALKIGALELGDVPAELQALWELK